MEQFDLPISQLESGKYIGKKTLFSHSADHFIMTFASCSAGQPVHLLAESTRSTLSRLGTKKSQSRMCRCIQTPRGDAESEMSPGVCYCEVTTSFNGAIFCRVTMLHCDI